MLELGCKRLRTGGQVQKNAVLNLQHVSAKWLRTGVQKVAHGGLGGENMQRAVWPVPQLGPFKDPATIPRNII